MSTPSTPLSNPCLVFSVAKGRRERFDFYTDTTSSKSFCVVTPTRTLEELFTRARTLKSHRPPGQPNSLLIVLRISAKLGCKVFGMSANSRRNLNLSAMGMSASFFLSHFRRLSSGPFADRKKHLYLVPRTVLRPPLALVTSGASRSKPATPAR